jgi:phenylacetate-CoA ligase
VPIVDPTAAWSRDLFAMQSSGSTGQPITVVKDGYDAVHMWAVLRFWLERLRITLPVPPSVALLCALPGGLEYTSDLPLLFDGRLLRISTVRPEPRERLLRADPHVLFSDPAGLHWLTEHGAGLAPRLVLTSAQRFGDAHREALVRVVQAPVIDYYATSETGPIAWRCLVQPSRLHVLSPDVFVESADGDLVVTRLRPSALPLIRYRTGDAGLVEEGPCACGATGFSIRGFEGRRACWFVTEGGRRVDAWSLAWVLKYMDLKDFQLAQVGPAAFDLRVVDGPTLDVGRLEAALRQVGWPTAVVSVRRVGSIAQQGSKPEPFVCALFDGGRS